MIKLGRYQEALETAQTSKYVDPSWTKGYIREAQAYELLKEYGDAAASYFEALKLDPPNKDLKYMFDKMVEEGKAYYKKTNKK